MDKDILCWLNQELYHVEIDEPRVWTLAVTYMKRLSMWIQMVEMRPHSRQFPTPPPLQTGL